LYDDATNIAVLVESPNKVTGANEIGVAIVTIHYVFSGQKNPLVPAVKEQESDPEQLSARDEEKLKLIKALAILD